MGFASPNWDELRMFGLARKTRQLGWNAYTVSNRNETEERETASGLTLKVTIRKAQVTFGHSLTLNENGQDSRMHFPGDDMSPHDLEYPDAIKVILARNEAREKQRQKRKRRRAQKARAKKAA